MVGPKQFCESPDVAWPSRPTRLKMEKFPHNERSRAVEPPTDCIAFDHTLQPNICHHTMRQNSATQIRFLTLYICNNSNEGWHHLKEFLFSRRTKPCLVTFLTFWTVSRLYNSWIHWRHYFLTSPSQQAWQRWQSIGGGEREIKRLVQFGVGGANMCRQFRYFLFSPHLTLWRNSFQFWPEDRLVGFITPPAPLDFRLIGSQAICCRLFFC